MTNKKMTNNMKELMNILLVLLCYTVVVLIMIISLNFIPHLTLFIVTTIIILTVVAGFGLWLFIYTSFSIEWKDSQY